MKTITNQQKKKAVQSNLYLLVVFVLAFTGAQAQVQNNGSLFIGDNATVFVESGAYNFGTGSTRTTRSGATSGKLIFGATASTAGAANAHSINGYGAVKTTSAFTLPLGTASVYAPIGLTPSSTATVDAAYFASAATTLGSALDPAVEAVSAVEYWDINGAASASITLTWRSSSNLAALGVAALSDITIVGFDGAQWVAVASVADGTSLLGGASTVTTGSITATGLAPNTYQAYSIGKIVTACPNLVASSGITKTWNGTSWSPSAPTIADPVVISGAYANGSFACNTLQLDANITLSNGQSVEIVNAASGTGKIIMASQASVVQRATGVDGPLITLNKRTRTTMSRYDYIYWGTPITGNFFSQIANAQASTAVLPGAFDLKYKYVSGAGGGWQTLTAIETGKAFITRIKQQAPFINGTADDFINFTFDGRANNGNVDVAITRNDAAPNAGTSHVLLANPYPSAIDADKFLAGNAAIDGALYIWTAATGNIGTVAYTQADYIAYTRAGAVVPSGVAETFNGKIASGQGFKVKSLTNAGTVTFTNCMRLTADNNNFYKTREKVAAAPKDRFKLNMTGDNGVFSQILVAYLPEATTGYDRFYDAGRQSVSTAQLFSVFEEDGSKLAINARPSFAANDIVPIGVSKTGTTSETFTISIAEKEGVFSSSQPVYIHDTVNDTYHDLSNGDFSLTTATNDLSRYKITYTAKTLSNPKFESNGVVAVMNNKTIKLRSNTPLTDIEVYDISGRKILSSNLNDALNSTTAFEFPQAVYIVKAKLNNGTVASFKLINNN